MNLRRLIPIFDSSVSNWALEARLLRWLTLIWLFVGLIMLFSASYPVADARHDDCLYYFNIQLHLVLVSLIGFNIIVNLPLQKILGQSHWF
ncbi:MAG: cell division protein FtsW, partial [Nostoc sp. C3-bin3]|nr:cell division protein FtsW [Nostoc sp. C3-bin3]